MNIGQIFIKLFNKPFLKSNKLHKTFKRNSLKLSCSKKISEKYEAAHHKHALVTAKQNMNVPK